MRINNKEFKLIIPSDIVWWNYHVTKHFIINDSEQNMSNLIQNRSVEISVIRNKQKLDYKCPSDDKWVENAPSPCPLCKKIENCYNDLEKLRFNYKKFIINAAGNDIKNPFNAQYFHLKYNKDSILIIDNIGMNLIGDNKKSKFCVKSMYRQSINDADQLSLSLGAIFGENKIYIKLARDSWKMRFSRRNIFKNVKLNKMENWK